MTPNCIILQACKQTAYYQRIKRNKKVLRDALVLPVLSLFPGIGLLDRTFEECGFTVVRGPDLLWGDDIRDFHPQPGHFGGIIGGPPCQAFSRLRHIGIALRKIRYGLSREELFSL